MSRPETFRALQIMREASERLAHRMTDAELERLAQYGAALIAVAARERRSRRKSLQSVAQNTTPFLDVISREVA
jgi:hypothetical protein